MWKTTREVLPNDRVTRPNLVSRSLTNEPEDKNDASLTIISQTNQSLSLDSNVPEDGDDEYPGYDVDDDRAAGRKKLGPIVHAHHEGHNVAEDAEMHDADHIDSSELGSDWDSNEEFGDDQRILAVGRKWLHEQDERARQNM
ncbi:hypothetical protein FRB96_005753 [Tulasnella sp. 330]|nr:hypothetical protein FRB96_005753 [Tulasnella sp. 330]